MTVELTMLAYAAVLLVVLVLFQATIGLQSKGLVPLANNRDDVGPAAGFHTAGNPRSGRTLPSELAGFVRDSDGALLEAGRAAALSVCSDARRCHMLWTGPRRLRSPPTPLEPMTVSIAADFRPTAKSPSAFQLSKGWLRTGIRAASG